MMKLFHTMICLLLAILYILPTPLYARKKVGLVLGGGGAKGVSHIGVLKVLEEAGIPIDYIAGTSMGAIVGGLYAIGYSATEIDSMVASQDWQLLLSDRVKRDNLTFPEKENSERYVISLPFGIEKKDRLVGGMIKGQNLQNLFSNLTIGYHDSVDFNSFPIPFACVAVNLVDGKDFVFQKGSLPIAMRASMAIPAAFTPVKLDSMVLVDGGLNNNYPADVVKTMGADIVIGVDLGTSDLKNLQHLNSTIGVVGQIVALHGYEKYVHNTEITDLLIRPNTSPYNSASFTTAALDTLIMRGEEAARKQWNELLTLKEKIGSDSISTNTHSKAIVLKPHDSFLIRKIYFEGADPRDEKWLLQISQLKENSWISLQKLHHAMSILIGTNAYSNVSYKLTGEDARDLHLIVEPKSASAVNVGLRFDSEEIIAVLLNGTFDYHTKFHSRFSVTGRVGKKTYGRVDYSIERNPLRNLNLSYKFTYQDLDIYHKGEKSLNTTFRNHFAEFSYSDMNWLSFKVQTGIRYEHYNYKSVLNNGDLLVDFKPQNFINYFVSTHFETLDRSYYPNRGVSLKANYTVYTDNFVGYQGHTPFSALSAHFLSVIPVTSHFSFLPALYGRVLIGRDAAFPYLNAIGGETEGHYLDHQLPFAGINHVEFLDHAFLSLRLQLRQRISSRHYISLIGNYGVHDDNFFNLLKGNHLWGGSLGYAYNSIFGPMNASFGLSNRAQKLQFFLNLGYYF
ncbi:MAG: patatin-like phospholipase family protein [Parabacteroides sp.]|nr:patatin-like phospholipase family protein [Parabacteroides sp.]MCI7706556.1 patatin-like phospholipase family protein [Parabacteroides sp.]MDY5624045.1 patatin-like phospholipase family protein [Bacteroidales bacterium]